MNKKIKKESTSISYTDLLKEENKEWLTRTLKGYALNDNYDGEYDFTLEKGLQLDWGKYGYNVDDDQQGEDYEMLVKATHKFNDQFIGRYVAIAEWSDKFNSVHIMDLQQLANQPMWMEEIKRYNTPAATQALAIIAEIQKQSNG